MIPNIGENIRRERLSRQPNPMSQKELAAEVGVTQTIVSAWERGQKQPGLNRLFVLAEVLGIPVEQLLQPDAEEPAA